MLTELQEPSSSAIARVWIWIVASSALLAGAAACGLRVISDFADGGGMSGWTFLSVLAFYPLLIAGLYPLSYALFALAAHHRYAAVSALRPSDLILQVGIPRAAHRQLVDAGRALGSPAVSPARLGFGALAVGRDSLILYSGGRSPRIGLIVPSAGIASAVLGPVSTGFGTRPGIILEFADASGTRWPVTIHPIRWRNVVPGKFRPVDVAALLAAMQATTHPAAAKAAPA